MLLTQNCLNFEINKSQACFQNSKIRISILMQLFSKEFNNLAVTVIFTKIMIIQLHSSKFSDPNSSNQGFTMFEKNAL